jgi:hypothetical protein
MTKQVTYPSIGEKRDKAVDWMIGEFLIWDTARRFIDGLQYGRYNSQQTTWVTEPSEPGVSRVTVNLLLPIYNRLQSMLSVVVPYVGVRPSSMTTPDMIAAKTEAAMIQYLWEQLKIADKMRDANRWLIVTGNSFLHAFYNPETSKVDVEVVAPYDILVQEGVSDIQNSEWLIKRSYLYESVIKRTYPKIDLSKVTAVSIRAGEERNNFTYASNIALDEDRYEVLECWDKSAQKHQILIGDQVAWEAKKYDPAEKFPIVHFRFHNLPGRLHGKGAIAPLIQIQKEYNAQRSAIITNIRRMGNLQWLIPNNSGVEEITNVPGAIIRFNAASAAPRQVPLNPLPGYVLDNVNRSHSEMLDLAGIHGTSLGKRVSGVQSGKAIDSLVQQDVSQLQGVLDSIEQGSIALSECMLMLVKRHYTKARMIRIFRYDGTMFFKTIKSTDLTDEPDIFLETGSLFKEHIKEREERAVQMLQLGLLTPEEAKRSIRFFGQDSQIQQSVRGYNYALDLLEAALVGDIVQIMPTDPLTQILEVFQEYSTTEDYRELPQEIQENVSSVLISVMSQGNPQVHEMLQTPVSPFQTFPQYQQQQQQPAGMGQPSAEAAQGGTSEGAAQRTEGQQQAQVYEGFNARTGGGM